MEDYSSFSARHIANSGATVGDNLIETRRSANSFDELCGSDAKSAGEFHDVDKTHVSLSALDAAHIVAMHVGQFRQLLLRQPSLNSQLTQSSAEHDAGICRRHVAIIGT